MAVKFSQFTQETDAANITRIVGYTASGNINVQIQFFNQAVWNLFLRMLLHGRLDSNGLAHDFFKP